MEKSINLSTTYPEIAKEWHPTKNGAITPDMVAPKSGKKAWWLGPCGHEWEAVISSRTRGVGCPYCSNYRALAGYNDLATTEPQLAQEWNYEKNGSLKPTDVTSGSHKIVWWKCSRGHEWERDINNRTSVPESLKVVLAASRVSPDEAEDAGGLTPGKDDNEVWRNPAPQIMPFLGLTEH